MFFKNVNFFILFFIKIIIPICSLTSSVFPYLPKKEGANKRLTIPLYSTKDLFSSNTTQEILDSLRNNILYSYIEIGEPPQRLPIIVTSHDSYTIITKNKCPIYSYYNIDLSRSVTKTNEDSPMGYYYINDLITFDNENKKLLVKMLHYNSTDNNVSCGYIGTENFDSNTNSISNLFNQLKNLGVIKKSIFFFNYTSYNNTLLNIGIEPFEVEPLLYSKKNVKNLKIKQIYDYEKKLDYMGKFRWNINFTKIFYFKKLPIESNLDPYVEVSRIKTRRVNFFQAILVPDEKLIKGPFEYQELIEDHFFNGLIQDNICKKITFERKYYFVCKKEYKALIQQTFPTIYFHQSDINYIFELNYNDLFIEQNEDLIFGIYFDYFQIEIMKGAFLSEWYFGKIFLKKYFFSFDLDNGIIKFYPQNKKKSENKQTKTKKKKSGVNNNIRYYQIGFILIVLGIGILAFIIDRVNKRKYRIKNSLIDYSKIQM